MQAKGSAIPLAGLPSEAQLSQALSALPVGPTKWIVDDLWAPAAILRDIVELPAGPEAREQFFRWKYGQTLALEGTHAVQSLPVGPAWLLVGMPGELRDAWMGLAARLGRPLHTLIPRWLWLYNRLAPTRELPGLLLSLCPHGPDEFTGTLAAWGRDLALLRQWPDPASPEVWAQERVAPTVAYLQRDGRTPQELFLWGLPTLPGLDLPIRAIQPEIPLQEAL
jgi:hypothetical protein